MTAPTHAPGGRAATRWETPRPDDRSMTVLERGTALLAIAAALVLALAR